MRRAVCLALLLVLAPAADAASARAKHRAKAKVKADPIPVRRDGRVARTTALKVFAATIAPLPGVKPPKRGYPAIHDGSGPIRWVVAHWSRLTSAQRAAVQKALPGIAVPGASYRPPARARRASVGLAELQPMLDEARARLNFRLEPDLTKPATVELGAAGPKGSDTDGFAYTTVGEDNACRVVFTPLGQADTLEDARLTMLHELIHCYQFQRTAQDLPAWLEEGATEWVSATLGAEWNPAFASPLIANRWTNYFGTFEAPLTERTVTAIGFFAQLAASGVDVFKALPDAYSTPDAVHTAYDVLLDPDTAAGKLFLDTEAASGLRRAALGPAWVAEGPMIPPAGAGKRYDPPTRVVLKTKQSGVKLIAAAYGNAAARITSNAEAVEVTVVTPETARGRIHAADGDHALASETFLCGGTACTCPDGSVVSPLGDQGYVAVFAHKAPAVVQLTPTSLDDACGHKSTLLQVTGAFTATFDRQGSCSVSSVDGGTLSAVFYSTGVGQVTLSMKRYHGPGIYQTGLDPPSGARGGPSRAAVVKFGEPGGGSWGVDVSADQPGTIDVATASPGGASGAVDTVSRSRDEPPTFVHVTGRWSCTTAPGATGPG